MDPLQNHRRSNRMRKYSFRANDPELHKCLVSRLRTKLNYKPGVYEIFLTFIHRVVRCLTSKIGWEQVVSLPY